MEKITRSLFEPIKKRLIESNKVIILYGPRQVGKTTLAKDILSEIPLKRLDISGDENRMIDIFSSRDLKKMKGFIEGYELLFIDEAQRIPDIGINLKIIHDAIPELKIITTGSSSFELAEKVKEPLTGRTWTYTLFPISNQELKPLFNSYELTTQLSDQLVYGMYPEIFSYENLNEKANYLKEISSSYLYKDILELTDIKHANKLRDLLRLLAYQVGSLVSISELAASLEINRVTVDNYIDLLEKAFIVFRLSGFSRNLRKEITKMGKIYFFDLGIRNAIINNFNPLSYRNDVGILWENFLMIERRKKMAYDFQHHSGYFWRTHDGTEIDYIEEKGGRLSAFEFKYGKKKKQAPKSWTENYPNATYECVNQENYLDFIL